jgi:uncharacterized protein
MKLIAIEEHFLTREVQEAWSAIKLELVDPSVAIHRGDIERRLRDLTDERIDLMDETGVDVQVLSLTTPALHDLGPEGIELARRINDTIAEAVARRPDRLQAFATLPVSAPVEAALELERCVRTLGFQGTMLCGRAGAHNLDDPSLLPIFQTAEALGAPILLHPRAAPQAVRDAYYSGISPDIDAALATYGLGWHYDAGIQFIRLLLAGHFDRMPRLQLILGHWGELVLFYAERLSAFDRASNLRKPVADYLQENLHVTASGMFFPHYLERAAGVVGKRRILFSTDYPYQYRSGRDARSFLESCGLDEEERDDFASGNWVRLVSSLQNDGGIP